MKNIVYICVAGLMALFVSGCETLGFGEGELKKGVHHRVSFHEIVKYPRATNLERAVKVEGSDETVWINVNFFIDSKNIKDVEVVDRDGEKGVYDLEMVFDEIGTLRWMQLSNAFHGEKVAMVVDGVVYKLLEIKERSNEKTKRVRLEGPFEFVKGKLVEKYAEHNYAFYH